MLPPFRRHDGRKGGSTQMVSRMYGRGRSSSKPGTAGFRVGVLVSLFVLGAAPLPWAHQDPGACSTTGVALEMAVFHADGTSLVGNPPISPCETIVYQLRLSVPAVGVDCAFQGGDLFITTADGVKHNVTPAGGIPCLGGTGAEPGCPAGQ